MSNQQNTVFIGNLSFRTAEDTIRSTFASFGNITEVSIPLDRETKRPRGFAFVTFETNDSAQKALAFDGNELDGRNIRVNIAQSKTGEGRSSEGRTGGAGRSSGGAGRSSTGGFGGGNGSRGRSSSDRY